MVVKCCQGPGFNSLDTDTFVLNWKTFPFPPLRNGLPFNVTTPGNKFHSTYFQRKNTYFWLYTSLIKASAIFPHLLFDLFFVLFVMITILVNIKIIVCYKFATERGIKTGK